MGRLGAGLSFLASGLPRLPSRVPAWKLIGPCGAVGVLAAGALGPQTPLQAVAMVALGASLVMVTHHPGWIVVPSLIVEFAAGGHQVPGVGTSLRVLVTLVAVLLAIAMLARSRASFDLDIPARRVALPAIAFIVVSTVIELLFTELSAVTKYLRYQLGLVITMALVLGFTRDRRALKILAYAALTLAVASSLVAIGQRIGGPLAMYTTSATDAITTFSGRAFGLSGSPVGLANAQVSVLVPVLGFLIVTWSGRMRGRLLLLLAMLVAAAGAYLATTRSALVATTAGVLVIFVAVDAPRRFALAGLGIAGALAVGAAVLVGLVDSRFLQGADEDQSAAGHVAIGQVALAVALDNPLLGIGRENFARVSRAYVSEVSLGGEAQRSGEGAIGTIQPHNDFLTVWTSWGLVGLLTYAAVLYGTLRNYRLASRSSDLFVRGLAVGGGAGTIAYLVNSAFHNSLDASVILWYYAGLSATVASAPAGAVERVAALRRRPTPWFARQRVTIAAAKA